MADSEELDRFAVMPPATGTLRIVGDVMVRYAGNEWLAIGHEPAVEGGVAQLGFGSDDSLFSFDVTVLESRPTIVGNDVRHRLRLGMPASATTGTPGESAGETFESGWVTGVLTRDLEVRLLAFSRAGCVLESDWCIRERTYGHLRVALAGTDFLDEVEIVLSKPRGVSSACELGAIFCEKAPVSELPHPNSQTEGLEGLVRSLTRSGG